MNGPSEDDIKCWTAKRESALRELGSRLDLFHSQNRTVAARAMAEKKVSGHLSYDPPAASRRPADCQAKPVVRCNRSPDPR